MTALLFDFNALLPTRLYWDASFLVHTAYPGGRYYRECYRFLERLNNAEGTLSYVSTMALDEALFALLKAKVSENYPNQAFLDVYRSSPDALQPYLGELRLWMDRLYADLRIQIVALDADCLPQALDEMENYALLPRDALHLTVMRRLKVNNLVTTDADFVSVDDLCLYTCNPRILAQA